MHPRRRQHRVRNLLSRRLLHGSAGEAVPTVSAAHDLASNILAGPISGRLLLHVTNPAKYGAMRYKGVIIFPGCCMLLSALSIGSWYARLEGCGQCDVEKSGTSPF